MSLKDIMDLLDHPAPAFICRNLTKRNDDKQYIVPVKHVLRKPLTPDKVSELRQRLPQGETANQLIDFYSAHNGANLFTTPRTGEPAISILPYEDWPQRHAEVMDWLEMEEEYADEDAFDLPYSIDQMLAFCELNYSPDTWLLATDGPMAGQFFFWGHDGEPLTENPYSNSFANFVSRLLTDAPDCFGGIVRFESKDAAGARPQGKAELYPVQYLPDCSTILNTQPRHPTGILGLIRKLFS